MRSSRPASPPIWRLAWRCCGGRAASRTSRHCAQAVVTRLVVRADTWFTTPTVFLQPLTGLTMAHLAGWPLSTPWILGSLALFFFAGTCWLPVVWLQIRMAKMAREAAAAGRALPQRYWRYAAWWEGLGYPAFIAMLGVFFLMIAKPALWG